MTLRPYAIVVDGRLKKGLEIDIHDGRIRSIQGHFGPSDPYVVSPAFVNAHSHLEYRGMLGKIPSAPFNQWLSDLLPLKQDLTLGQAQKDANLAAVENKATGVAYLAEHSDLPVSAKAMAQAGLTGQVFQELITFNHWNSPFHRIEEVCDIGLSQQKVSPEIQMRLGLHAIYSVDPKTLRTVSDLNEPHSIHVAESVFERHFVKGYGPFAQMHLAASHRWPKASSPVDYLGKFGLLRGGIQMVHACDVDDKDIRTMADAGVAAAHCPRSNQFLQCPVAPVARMRRAGIKVGLGMDSVASGGPIDMFQEMRCAISSSFQLGDPIGPEDAWQMATQEGAESLGLRGWRIEVGSQVPLIAIDVPNAETIDDLLEHASPNAVRWL